MKHRFLTLLLTLLIGFQVFAQKEDYIWVVGSNRIDFKTEPPTITHNGNFKTEVNLSSVCDYNGELIYWVNSNKLYNKDNEVVFEFKFSNGLFPILPFLNDKNKYMFCGHGTDGYIHFYIIDGTLDALHPQIKDYAKMSYTPLTGNCIPVQKKNSRDFWLLFDQYHEIEVYSITEAGLKLHSTFTKPKFNGDENEYFGAIDIDYYRVSYDNTKIYADLVCTIDKNLYYNIDFDNERGIIKTIYPTYAEWDWFYGETFSSKGKYLYFTIWDTGEENNHNPNNKNEEFQHIYRCPTEKLLEENSLLKYRELVYTCKSGKISDMKCAPDGNIYILYDAPENFMGVIKNSDAEKPEVEERAFDLSVSTDIQIGDFAVWFPETYHFPFEVYYNKKCDYVEFAFSDNYKEKSLLWNFGDGTESSAEKNPKHSYKSGSYKVKLTVDYDDKETKNYVLDVDIPQKPKTPAMVCE